MGKTLVIGVGGAGCSMAGYIGPALDMDVLFVNFREELAHASVGAASSQKWLDLGRRPAKTAVMEAEAAAEQEAHAFADMLAGYGVVTVVVGLGGATGSGAASVLARIAGTRGLRVTAIATMPFAFEEKRIPVAQAALPGLRQQVDSLILVDHARGVEPSSQTQTSLPDYFEGVARDAAVALRNLLKDLQ
ncbi:hypothetical protein [Alkalilimnicola sp. S0819]|uniref:hypothetical protein n=1 Tax=Alkalilimnicola sp. S0819 TaxID=2613922 RepID=UPI0018699A13|nr:hypothetical protein [Alkalilimnicola sp. S0819]